MSIAQKTPLARTLNVFASQKAYDEIRKRGLGVPGRVVSVTGPIVTVSFEVNGLTLPQVVMPLACSQYVRLPIQPGEVGVAIPASFSLGGISGLGGGIAKDSLQGNLSTLVWVPIGTTGFFAVDSNVLTLYGPKGVTIQDEAGATMLKITPTSISMNAAGHSIVINSTGIVIDGAVYSQHKHLGVTSGTSESGPVGP